MKHIVDPRTLLSSAPPDSPYWALIDSFDAATNGLENPEAFARLSAAADPELAPWQALVTAIRAVYAQNEELCAAQLDRMDEAAAPSLLKPLFRAWLQTCGPERSALPALADAPAAVALLFQRLTAGTHPLVILAEQAEEALRQGMTDHYEGISYRIMRDLQSRQHGDGPALAVRYAVRSLRSLEESGCAGNDYFSVVLRALGRVDGFFSLGLALLEHDQPAAAAAFRGALEASDGHFVEAGLRPVLIDLIALLEAVGTSPGKSAPPEARSSGPRHGPEQLELFSSEVWHG